MKLFNVQSFSSIYEEYISGMTFKTLLFEDDGTLQSGGSSSSLESGIVPRGRVWIPIKILGPEGENTVSGEQECFDSLIQFSEKLNSIIPDGLYFYKGPHSYKFPFIIKVPPRNTIAFELTNRDSTQSYQDTKVIFQIIEVNSSYFSKPYAYAFLHELLKTTINRT